MILINNKKYLVNGYIATYSHSGIAYGPSYKYVVQAFILEDGSTTFVALDEVAHRVEPLTPLHEFLCGEENEV